MTSPSYTGPRSDLLRSMSDLAKLASSEERKVTTEEMLHTLKKLDHECGGKILRKLCGRYVATIADLRRYGWPDFGKRLAMPEDLEDMARRVRDLEQLVRRQQVELRICRRRLRVLEGGEQQDDEAAA